MPAHGVSHVSVGGIRNEAAFNVYVTLADFPVSSWGRSVNSWPTPRGQTIMVLAARLRGYIKAGRHVFPVLKWDGLKTLLAYGCWTWALRISNPSTSAAGGRKRRWSSRMHCGVWAFKRVGNYTASIWLTNIRVKKQVVKTCCELPTSEPGWSLGFVFSANGKLSLLLLGKVMKSFPNQTDNWSMSLGEVLYSHGCDMEKSYMSLKKITLKRWSTFRPYGQKLFLFCLSVWMGK